MQGDVFCLPTVSEGFSGSMLEAAAAGMDIIITETGGVEELLVGDDYGIVLQDDSPDAAADAILAFYNDRGFLERCGTNVAARVREYFTWNKVAGIYRSCLMREMHLSRKILLSKIARS